jgi:hypothetical protein
MSAITELSATYDSLVQFFQDQSDYLISGGVPATTTALEGLGYPELLSYVIEEVQGPASFVSGAAQEAILTTAGMIREINMAKMSKTSLYNNVTAEVESEVNFYSSSGAFLAGVVSGASTTGSRS